jgi:hypothetical protein
MKSSAKRSPDKKGPKGQKGPASPEPAAQMPLGAANYLFVAIGVAVIALSYAGMYIEKSVDGFFSISVAPFTLVGAYLWVLFAIFYRKKEGKS